MPVMQEEGAPDAPAQWGSLPREVLALVFLSLPLKDRQAPLTRCCRQWRPDSHPACAARPAATPAPCGGWRRRLWRLLPGALASHQCRNTPPARMRCAQPCGWLCRCCAVGAVCTWWREVLLEGALLNDLNLSRLPLFSQVLHFWAGGALCAATAACCRGGFNACTARPPMPHASLLPPAASERQHACLPARLPADSPPCSVHARCETFTSSAPPSPPGCCAAAAPLSAQGPASVLRCAVWRREYAVHAEPELTACMPQQHCSASPCPAPQAAVAVCRALGGRQPGGGAAPGGGRCGGPFVPLGQEECCCVHCLYFSCYCCYYCHRLLIPPAGPYAVPAALPACACRGGGTAAGGSKTSWHRGGAHHLRLPLWLLQPAGAAARLLGPQQPSAACHG